MPTALTHTHDILDRVLAGQRLSEEEAVHLFDHAELPDLGLVAQQMRNRLNDPQRVSYVVDRNVNYTNICHVHCTFCAFWRKADAPDAYTLSNDQLHQKVLETKNLGGTGFLLQGGVNERITWQEYLDMVRFLSQEEGIWVHGFSPVEIQWMAQINGLGLKGTLAALKEAGLGSLPGGGAEILVDRIRSRISARKGNVASWLEVMDAAHEVGLNTTATMMYGITETHADRVEHFRAIRCQQDRAHQEGWVGKHTAFIAWPFQSGHTVWEGRIEKPTDIEYLRTIAIARIYLDNFQHVQSSWVTMGPKVGQLALHFGCDDMGSLMIEENVVSAAGTTYSVNRAAMTRMIKDAGFTPWQRDNIYRPVGNLGS